jgi:tight adherence protein B
MSAVLLCAAGALLLWPRARRRAGSPLGPGPWWHRAALGELPLGRSTAVLAVAAAVLTGIASTPLVAVLVAGAVGAAGQAWGRRRDAVVEEQRLRGLAEALGAFAADLRAGRSAEEAVSAAVTACPDQAAGRSLAVALRAPAAGPAPPVGRGDAWAAAVSRLAAAVRLSNRTGCSLAAVACAVEDDVRARLRQRQDLRTAVAAPRASAALLAGLPALALLMGGGVGADPWRVLTTTPTGQLLLVVGVALEAAGVTWSARLVRRALP